MPPRTPIVGIDLGTTNSLVAVANWAGDAGARVIGGDGDDGGEGTRGGLMLPSVVRFAADGSVEAVGRQAREEAVLHPLRTVSSAKRLMGRLASDARADMPYLPYRVVEGPRGAARVALPLGAGGEKQVSPQEVSAIILRALKERASRALGVEVTRAVVTAPAYFDDAQRQATRDAGRLAGLEVVRIVNEPTAAALAYGIGVRQAAGAADAPSQTIVVYDLGGGTFDVSVLRLSGGQAGASMGGGSAAVSDFFQVLATAGDTHLGGDDFDHALVELFTREIGARFFGGAALDLPPATRQALVRFAEQAKIRLSEQEEARVRIDVGEGRVYERTVTRAEFEELIAPLVERTIESCRRALRDARRQMEQDEVSAVVLVGGATRTPLVRRRVAEAFGLTPYTALDPDLVVALGAAVQAGVLMDAEGEGGAGTVEGRRRALLLDVVPLSLGIETAGGAMAKLIMRNSTVPTRAHEMFSTSVDGQTSVKIHILQGEREMAADARSLGVFHLRGIPPMPAGIPKLRVEFFVDVNGILSVSAVEQRSGKRLDVQVVPNHGLSPEEVERIERESVEHAREDMTRHRIVDLVANTRLDLAWIEKTLARIEKAGAVGGGAGGDGPRVERAYVEDLARQIAELKAMIDRAQADWRSVNAEEFYKAKERLDRASVRLHEVAIALSLREEKA